MWTTPRHCLISGQQEGILDVHDSDILTGNEDSDHIEPIDELWSAVSIHPNTSAPAEFPTFAEVDRFHRMAEGIASSGFHFHECDLVAASHDEVDIAMPAAETMGDKFPSVASHPARGNAFAQQPERLSLFRHGRTLSRSLATCVTRTAQADSNERDA